jgi:hypothetical protein
MPQQQSRMMRTSNGRTGALIVVRRLINRDAVERQRAAEELARLADPEPRNLVEGYRLQEKNARVRLALDWALYRMGKTEALFGVVQSLDSSRESIRSLSRAVGNAGTALQVSLSRQRGDENQVTRILRAQRRRRHTRTNQNV